MKTRRTRGSNPKADRGRNWCDEEVLLLISVWSDDVIQAELEGCHWNQHIFHQMSDELSKHEYERRWEKCKDKIKKFKQEYKEVVDDNTETGRKRKTFRFLKEIDAVLGYRPATKLPAVVPCGKPCGKPCSVVESDEESDVEEEISREASLADDVTSTVIEVCTLLFSV